MAPAGGSNHRWASGRALTRTRWPARADRADTDVVQQCGRKVSGQRGHLLVVLDQGPVHLADGQRQAARLGPNLSRARNILILPDEPSSEAQARVINVTVEVKCPLRAQMTYMKAACILLTAPSRFRSESQSTSWASLCPDGPRKQRPRSDNVTSVNWPHAGQGISDSARHATSGPARLHRLRKPQG